MNRLLSTTNEYLVFNEADAYGLIEQRRAVACVETSSVKYKKATKTKVEHYIVTIKERMATADDYVRMDGEE